MSNIIEAYNFMKAITVGNMKFSNAHNSCKLFCSGVPVSSNRNLESSIRTTLLSYIKNTDLR